MKLRARLASVRREPIKVFLLALVTAGVYDGFWYLRTRRLLDAGMFGRRFGSAAPILLIVLASGSILAAVAPIVTGAPRVDGLHSASPLSINDVLLLALCVVRVGIAFMARTPLETVAERVGKPQALSKLATLLFGTAYLQYVINELAETPTRVRAAQSGSDVTRE